MNILKSLVPLCAAAALLAACDYVSVPQQVGGPTGPSGGNGVAKRVLVEDYTGHFCNNCPRAAEEIHTLEAQYDSLIIPIAVHVGNFAWPASLYGLPNGAPSNSFPMDFRTPEGNDWETFFQPFAFPVGMINRYDYPNNHMLTVENWGGLVAQELAKPATADIRISHTYNPTTRMLDVTISGEMLRDTSGTFFMKTVITEDSVYEWQLDSELNPEYAPYYHSHMLRGAVDNPGSGWGDTAVAGIISAQTAFTRTYNNYQVNAAWNDTHCDIVTFIYDNNSKQVLQAAKKKLR